MAGDIAKLLASLDLDTRPFSRGAGRVSGDLSKMEGGFSRISTRATALGTAVGVGIERLAEKGISVLFDSIHRGEEELRTLQDAQAQTAGVIESTGGKAGVTADQVRQLAESIEDLTTADDKAVQQGENLLLTFTNIGGDVFPQATKAIVDLGIALNKGNAETADFDGAAIQLGKALSNPIKGLTALRRIGVVFSADQEKLIRGFIKQGDVVSAQKVILGEIEKEFGKAGEAAGTSGAAGIRRLNDAVEDSQRALAEGLAPALEDIRGEITKGLKDPSTQTAIRNLGVFLGDAAKSGLAFAKSVPWGQVADGLKTAAGFAGKLFDAFANLPPGVQATIIGLAGLNKLAGGGVIRVGVDLFKEGAQGLFKGLFQRGSSPANPLFVTSAGLGGAGAAAGGIGAAGKLFLVGEAIGLIAAVEGVRESISAGLTQQATDIHGAVTSQINAVKPDFAAISQSLAGVNQGIDAISSNPLNVLVGGDALTELQNMRAELGAALKATDDTTKANFRQSERDDASAASKTQDKLTMARTAIQDSERALVAKAQATTTRVGDLQRTTATGTDRIVDAIERIKLDNSVKVFVDSGDAGNRTSYESSTNIGGGGGRKKP